jgi:hypothetical protein
MIIWPWSRPAAKRIIPAVGSVNMAKAGQGGEDAGNGGLGFSALPEGARKDLRVERPPRVAERGKHCRRSLHVARGKERLLLLVGDENKRRLQLLLARPRFCPPRDARPRALIIRPKPAHEAALFLGCALRVERDEASQNFVVGKVDRPPVGLRDERIDLVVQFLESPAYLLVTRGPPSSLGRHSRIPAPNEVKPELTDERSGFHDGGECDGGRQGAARTT